MKKKQDLRLTNIIKKVKETINKYAMLCPNERIIVGVSGGPDSVCLLHILYNLRDYFCCELIAAHFEHGLRPGEDEKETEFVRSLAEELNIPFECEKPEYDIKNGPGSLEEKARIARYMFLEQVRKKQNAHKIALGHNMNDQAETTIMRLLRGSGVSGLAGIPAVRDNTIIRPIIELSRDDIIYYLQKNGLSYVNDSSNWDKGFLRNRIRHELIPILKQYQPNIIEILSKTSEILRIEDDFIKSQAKEWVDTHVLFKDDFIAIPIHTFKELHIALKNRVIRYLLRKKTGHLRRITHTHINDIINMVDAKRPNMEIHLPYEIIAKKMYNWILIRKKEKQKDFCYTIPCCGTYYLDAIDSWVNIEETSSVDSKEENTVFLNAEMVQFPIVIRNVKPGDRIALPEIKGHKKIKDIFIDMKVPRDLRRIIPILVYRDSPIYIWWLNRIDEKYKAKPENKRILKVNLRTKKFSLYKYIYKEANYATG